MVNQPEETNTREIVIRTTTEKLGQRIPFDYACRIGRKTQHTNRRILIRLTDYDDKEELLRYVDNSPCLFENYFSKDENPFERVHTSLMKKALNVSKYSSNTCLYGELARFPMSHNVWALCVKCWIRLYNGTNNVLLNKCFQLSVSVNHQWIQSMKFFINIKWAWRYLVRPTNDLWPVAQTL